MIKRMVPSLLIGITLWTTAVQADGLGLFAAYLNPSDTDAISGVGLRGRSGTDLLYFELRGTFFESIPELDFEVDQEISILPVDLGFGWHTDWESPLQFYGGGGFTIYLFDTDGESVDDALGYYLEIGGEVEIALHVGLFFEILWRDVDTQWGNELNKRDLSIDGGAVHIGVMLRR